MFDSLLNYVLPFLAVLTVLVCVHESGHYFMARAFGVRVEAFSFGFGPELFGLHDRAGTRWKFSLIPLGGYVKMFGETISSDQQATDPTSLSEEERRFSFQHKSLGQRSLIVVAGPFANFLFAIISLAGLFMIYGQPFTPPHITVVHPDSAAQRAGLAPGDIITQINDTAIERFEQVQYIVRSSPEQLLSIVVERDSQQVSMLVIPDTSVVTNFGLEQTIGVLGISGGTSTEYRQHSPMMAIWRASSESVNILYQTLVAIGQILSGTRGTEELGGPLRIAQLSGEIAQASMIALIWFMAILSINLGLINLFPIPILDGGHLLFYAIEAVYGKPLGQRVQEYGFRIGVVLVMLLMIFATWNDLVQLQVIEFFRNLIS